MEHLPENSNNQEILGEEINLRDYWRVIIRYRWIILATFVIIFIMTAITTFKMIPIYKATAQIQIDNQNPNVLSIKEVVSTNLRDDNYLLTQYKILQSRSLARSVIDKLDLARHKNFMGDKNKEKNFITTIKDTSIKLVNFSLRNFFKFFTPSSRQLIAQSALLSPDEIKKERESLLTNSFLKNVQIEPVRNSSLVNISFLSKDPRLATKVANTIAEQYIQRNVQRKNEAAIEANAWLNQHVEELKKKLQTSEEAIHVYKERNKIVSLEEKQNIIVQKLSNLNSAVTDAKTKRIGVETLYKQIQKFNSNEEVIESLPSVINNSLIQKLKTQYISLQAEYKSESQKYGPKHPQILKIASRLKALEKPIDTEVNKIVGSIKTEYEVALAQEEVLFEALEEQKREALELNKKAIRYNVLKRDAESNKQMFEVVLNRLKETDLTRGLKTSNVSIVDLAEVPRSPIKPKKKLNLMLASLLGFFIGVFFAFFLEYLDNTIKTPDDLKRYLNLPFLGPVPHFDQSEQKEASAPELITLHKIKSQISEAYKRLRTNIMFSFPDSNPKAILITSASPLEGKTITAINLAVTMAQSGARVVIVDCDMRKPRLHKILKIPNDKGISNFLIGQCPLEELIQEGPMQNLSVITCGHRPPNPSELLVSPNLKRVLEKLKTQYDFILIDSPPVVPVTDSVIISRVVDGVALVLNGGITNRDLVIRGRDLLQSANAHLLGAIINNIDLAKRNYCYYYKNYYYQYYGDSEEDAQ